MIKTFALGWALYIFWIFAQIYCAMNPAMAQNQSPMGNRTNRAAFYIPDRWWTDQDQSELRCDRYPPADQWMRPMCVEKVRGEK